MENMMVAYGVVFCLAWWLMYGRIIKIILTIKDLSNIDVVTPDEWPSLNIVIAACNEEEGIEKAIQSLLLQDYPNLKIILVNDRSTDDTGSIINKLAIDERVTAIHIKILPENWLGKVHALSIALKQVDSEWVLFTDADIHFEAGALKKSVSYAKFKKVDHLALMPDIITKNYWLEVVVRTFGLMFLLGTRVDELEKPKTKTFVGLGAFNLFKKAILKKSKGIEWLRMEVIDDVGLGLLIKKAGGKSAFAMAQNLLSVAWYPSVRAMFVGLEKNIFGAAANYQIVRLLIIVGFIWAFIFAPFIVLAVITPMWLNVLALLTLLWIPVMMLTLKISSAARYSIGFFVPLGQFIFSLMMLWSAFTCLMRGGIKWRGTLYPIKKLKEYQRVKI
jgi:glycosyltransferase involved in cell wall biosynthesis